MAGNASWRREYCWAIKQSEQSGTLLVHGYQPRRVLSFTPQSICAAEFTLFVLWSESHLRYENEIVAGLDVYIKVHKGIESIRDRSIFIFAFQKNGIECIIHAVQYVEN